MLAPRLALTAVLTCATPAATMAQRPGNINLAQTCFDSLPHGEPHACEAVLLSRSKIPVGQLYSRMQTALALNALEVTQRDSGERDVLLHAASQPLRGECTEPFAGLDSLHPMVAVHFDASRRGKQTHAVVLIRGSAISAPGVVADDMLIALCLAAAYLKVLDFPDYRD